MKMATNDKYRQSKTYGGKNPFAAVIKGMKDIFEKKKGWKVYSTIRKPHEWKEEQ